MRPDRLANWAFTEEFQPEGPAQLAARARARELGVPHPSPGTCALLTVLAAGSHAHSAVEIGTSAGVAALAIVAGMPAGGVLTSVDAEAEHQNAAREAFAEAGVAPSATRLINSRPAEVLPRLADSAYDLVFLSGSKADYPDRAPDALRLLRPGGMLVVDGALAGGNVPDPARRDPITVGVRELGRDLRADDHLWVAMVDSGDGLLIAVKK